MLLPSLVALLVLAYLFAGLLHASAWTFAGRVQRAALWEFCTVVLCWPAYRLQHSVSLRAHQYTCEYVRHSGDPRKVYSIATIARSLPEARGKSILLLRQRYGDDFGLIGVVRSCVTQ
ncbi:hypothetical protein [Halotalea alkalilenta]|uniref:Uncharacterized protein n=1 Tax=Halotalea alkalilenta TaxID=376489 RepID=A0A172YGH3_9GAMM|nr:hypothetical protein [Halotalea alkalilenta]ANF58055.1 hypothetical protein A5892_11740 [Halotalea alkalilenta]